MRECNIFFLPKNDNEFFKLECCPNNLCNECKSKLVKTICPFCRTYFSLRPMASVNENYFLFSTVDDIYTSSRWYRRYLRRIERQRQITNNNTMNRNINTAFNKEQKIRRMRKNKKHYKKEIQNQVKEYQRNRSNSLN